MNLKNNIQRKKYQKKLQKNLKKSKTTETELRKANERFKKPKFND